MSFHVIIPARLASTRLPQKPLKMIAGKSMIQRVYERTLKAMEHANTQVHERAARPKHVEVVPELPKTAVGKIFKPDLRKMAITRVYDAALAEAGLDVRVAEVVDDKKRGLVARLAPKSGDDDVTKVLGEFTRPWEWAD